MWRHIGEPMLRHTTQIVSGVVSASDWAAALAAAIPDYEKRGRALLNIAGAIDADILDLVFKGFAAVLVWLRCVSRSLPQRSVGQDTYMQGYDSRRWIAWHELCERDCYPGSALCR